MLLGQLLKKVAVKEISGDPDLEIKGLAYDSRLVEPGYLFVAVKGNKEDGHRFVEDALSRGAVAIVGEQVKKPCQGIVVIQVPNSREALSKLSAAFYDPPFGDMTLIGITGTNGKTTTTYLVESILKVAGATPGVVGTVNYRFGGRTIEAPVTTPESLELMKILKEMADAGVTDVAMEVSSHALDQGRVKECPFKIAVFTNISRDHLDYHQSMNAYFEAKSMLFRGLSRHGFGGSARAVINIDDPRGYELVGLTDVPVVTYGLGKAADIRADGIEASITGLRARLIADEKEVVIRSPLIGEFNIYNILAASAATLSMGIDIKDVVSGVAALKKVPGRLELVPNDKSLALVVDYAHTPDALFNALKAVRPLARGRLITLFGCGGDRDKGKRKEMGLVASKQSDLVFITSDNPRTEDPAFIAAQIEEGVRSSGLKKLKDCSGDSLTGPGYFLDLDRGHAIGCAVRIATRDDLVLIAGKGHEDYQIIGEEKRFFDDRIAAARVAAGEI